MHGYKLSNRRIIHYVQRTLGDVKYYKDALFDLTEEEAEAFKETYKDLEDDISHIITVLLTAMVKNYNIMVIRGRPDLIPYYANIVIIGDDGTEVLNTTTLFAAMFVEGSFFDKQSGRFYLKADNYYDFVSKYILEPVNSMHRNKQWQSRRDIENLKIMEV